MNKQKLVFAIFGKDVNLIPSDDDIERALACLNERERLVLEHRFSDEGMTFEEIGRIYPRAHGGIGVCRERIRQVERKAFRRLRHPSTAGILRPYSVSLARPVALVEKERRIPSLPPEKYNMPPEELNLSVRTYNWLKRAGIDTLGQLAERSERELMGLRHFRQKSMDEVKERLQSMGIKLKGDKNPETPQERLEA